MLGKLEEFVLIAAHRRARGATAADIFREIETSLELSFSFGAIHTTLTRLADKGYLEISQSPKAKESGRVRKLYRLNAIGAKALTESLALSQKMLVGSLPKPEGGVR